MKSLKWFCVIGAVVTIALGIVSHFVYDWTGGNFFVGLFFPVNESTWEHMKLLFFPMFTFAMVAGKKVEKEYPCINNAMFTGILVGLMLIPTIFYTYSGILGFNVDWVNIALYVISVVVSYYVVYRVAEKCTKGDIRVLRYVMYAFLLAFMFFSVYPPKLGLFVSPM